VLSRLSSLLGKIRPTLGLGMVVILLSSCSVASIQETEYASEPCSQIGPSEEISSAKTYPTRDGRMLGRTGQQSELEGFVNEFESTRISRTPFREVVQELVVDEFGPYSVTAIDLPSVESLDTKTGRLPEDTKESGVKFLTEFVALHLMDGIFLDNPARLKEWYETFGKDFFDKKLLKKQMSNELSDYYDVPLVRSLYFTWGGEGGPRLVRDGGPRVMNKKIAIRFAEDLDLEDGSALDYGLRVQIQFEGLAVLDASGWWNEHSRVWGPDGYAININNVDTPFHALDAHQLWSKLLQGELQLDLRYSRTSGWTITDYYNSSPNFDSSSSWGVQPELVAWRNSLRSCAK